MYIRVCLAFGSWIINESNLNVDIFFHYPLYPAKSGEGGNDLKITHSSNLSIVSADDYYPFGLTFNEYQNQDEQGNDFLYNGKELQTDLNLDWYDYGARMYDAAIGRWHVVDALADSNWSYSPYNYVENNPLIFIDPYGLDNYYIYGNGNMYVVENDDKSNSYTYFNDDGNTHELGTFDKNDKGLMQLSDFSYNQNGLNIAFDVKDGNENKSYVSGDVMASLFGTVSDNNTTDLTIISASKSDGTSPWPSKSHVNGTALDLRYFDSNMSGNRVKIYDSNLDVSRQNTFNESLTKFGWTKMLSTQHKWTGGLWNTTYNIYPKLSQTSHYKNHSDHLHVGGKYSGVIRYSPSKKVIK